MAYSRMGKHCSKRCRYLADKNHPDPYMAKARTMASSVRAGGGKWPKIAALLRDACDKPCRYCGQIVTLTNANLDHVIPLGPSQNVLARRELDRIENLQVICARCNGLKGDLTHEKYQKLLDFLRTDPDIYRRVMRRLADAKHAWVKRR